MNITISPVEKVRPHARHDARHHAHLNDRLITTSRTPLFCAARVLIEEGVSPDEPLTMTHRGSETICIRTTVGKASKLTVQDNDKGLTLRPYKPSPYERIE